VEMDDRQLKKYDFVRYNDFVIQNEGLMKNVLELARPPLDLSEVVYVVMLI